MELNIVSSEPEVPKLPGIGKTVDLFGYTWLACHNDGTKKYLITNDIIKEVQWNTTNTTTGEYAESNIKRECDQFAKDTGIDQLDYVVDTGVGKVFIPTKEQMQGESGGFGYFNSNNRRIANYNGNPYYFWTATKHDSVSVLYVRGDGDFMNGYTSYRFGFRPCICIDTTLYNS